MVWKITMFYWVIRLTASCTRVIIGRRLTEENFDDLSALSYLLTQIARNDRIFCG